MNVMIIWNVLQLVLFDKHLHFAKLYYRYGIRNKQLLGILM